MGCIAPSGLPAHGDEIAAGALGIRETGHHKAEILLPAVRVPKPGPGLRSHVGYHRKGVQPLSALLCGQLGEQLQPVYKGRTFKITAHALPVYELRRGRLLKQGGEPFPVHSGYGAAPLRHVHDCPGSPVLPAWEQLLIDGHGYHGEPGGVLVEPALVYHALQQGLYEVLPAQLPVGVQIGQQVCEEPGVHRPLRQEAGVHQVDVLRPAQFYQQPVPLRLVLVYPWDYLHLVLRVGVVEADDGVHHGLAVVVVGKGILIGLCPGIAEAEQAQSLPLPHQLGADFHQGAALPVEKDAPGVFKKCEAFQAVQVQGNVDVFEYLTLFPAGGVIAAQSAVSQVQEMPGIAGAADSLRFYTAAHVQTQTRPVQGSPGPGASLHPNLVVHAYFCSVALRIRLRLR